MLTLFAHPEQLWLGLGLVPLAAWLFRSARRRRAEWSALGQADRVPGDGAWGWLAALALVILALGQPRWGRIFGPDAPAGHDVVVVVDLSRSMAAEDAVPNRLGVAVESSSSLLRALETSAGNRVSIVGFAGRGVVRCPLTSSIDAALEVLRSLKVGEITPGGTDLGSALEAAIGAFDDEEHVDGRTIVVFSDGEDHVGSWTSMVDRLKANRIIVHSVAIGDPEKGYPVPGRSGQTSSENAPADETRRSDVALRELALATGGAVVPLGLAAADLGTLFRDKIEPTARTRRADLRLPERAERFPIFLLGAIACGLAASWPGLARRRAGRIVLVTSTVAVVLIALGAGPAVESPARLISQGETSFAQGKFAEALNAFERVIRLEPGSAIPRYDAAAALFPLHRFAEAVSRYEEARERADALLTIKIDYALGNTRLALGDIPGALKCYDDCLSSTLPGAVAESVRNDARENRDFAARHLPPEPNPTERGNNNAPRTKKPRPKGSDSKDNNGDPDPSEPTSNDPGGTNTERNPSTDGGNRGSGGAGGSGAAPPRAGSPESRLDESLKVIQDNRSRRPADPPPSRSKGNGKDW